jgi:hypothetical protein
LEHPKISTDPIHGLFPVFRLCAVKSLLLMKLGPLAGYPAKDDVLLTNLQIDTASVLHNKRKRPALSRSIRALEALQPRDPSINSSLKSILVPLRVGDL